ncbi:MAG: glutamate 5-kinase [Coprococcus sp.]
MINRGYLKNKKKIVIKIGSSSLIHEETGGLDYAKLEKLVRIICDLKNQDKDVILVSSGAISVGMQSLGLQRKPKTTSLKQACAAVGQGQLMMIYQKLFYEYHTTAAQVLLTFDVISSDERRRNAINTFSELLQLGVIPIVNENDTVAVDEVETWVSFGDNDTLSAIVASLTEADLLILLTDIDGLYTDDPRNNSDAKLIHTVDKIDENIKSMAKDTATNVGTGGMATKIAAARIATNAGSDMVIISGENIDNINKVLAGEEIGTLFTAYKDKDFDIVKFILEKEYLE